MSNPAVIPPPDFLIVNRPVLVPQVSVTFADLVSELLPIYETKSKSTYAEFEITTRVHLLPYFRDKQITEVPLFWRAYSAYQKGINPKRKVFHDRKILRLILYYAKEQRLIDFIPRMPLDKADRVKRKRLVVSWEDVEQVRKHCTPLWRDVLLIAYETGMRFGEIRQMRKQYIDFPRGLIHLPGEIVKTGEARSYPASKAVLECFQDRINRSAGDLLFPKRGNPAEPMTTSRRGFQRALKAAGLKFQIHDLRSTFISRCVKRGAPIDVVGKLVGASRDVIRDVYLQVKTEDWFSQWS